MATDPLQSVTNPLQSVTGYATDGICSEGTAGLIKNRGRS